MSSKISQNSLLFGNGINQLSKGAIPWKELLEKIKGANKFASEKLPYTKVYEQSVLTKMTADSNSKESELLVKTDVAKLLESQSSNPTFEKLLGLDFSHFMTTNYDYALLKNDLVDSYEDLSSEQIYSLRRKKRVTLNTGHNFHFWNIHGELNHPKTIMLGLDQYCGSVSKLDQFIKGSYRKKPETKEEKSHASKNGTVGVEKMLDKLKDNNHSLTSWVDQFFFTNVHILGLGLDYNETDIWWLLNKRARFSQQFPELINNEITFYDTHLICPQKENLLKAFNVNVVKQELKSNNGELFTSDMFKSKEHKPDFESLYLSLISKMNVSKRERLKKSA